MYIHVYYYLLIGSIVSTVCISINESNPKFDDDTDSTSRSIAKILSWFVFLVIWPIFLGRIIGGFVDGNSRR